MDYRQRIVSSYKELAVTRGFSRVTVDELAAHTGVSKRTIYRYFNRKEDIIAAVLEEFMSTMSKTFETALNAANGPVEKIVNVVREVPKNINMFQPHALYDLQKYYPHLWERIELFRAGKIQEVFEKLVLENQQACFKDVHPKVFTTALLASIRAVVNPNFIMENNLSVEETIHSLFTIFLYGIVAERKTQCSPNHEPAINPCS